MKAIAGSSNISRPKSGSQYSRSKRMVPSDNSQTLLPMTLASNALALDINRVNTVKV